MEEEKNKDNSEKFGKVIDTLHSKQKLSSLRTYQGDMAEFIKEKNQSTISIALKEKERNEDREKKQEIKEKEDKNSLIPTSKKSSSRESFKINLTSLVLSLLLLTGGAVAFLYIFQFIKKEPVENIVVDTEIIPYNNFIILANLTNKNIGEEFAKLTPSNGVSIIKISDSGGAILPKAQDLLDFLGISLPATLERTLKSEYAIGTISQNNQKYFFLVLSVNDFGRAFSGMLEWEKNMEKDLAFFNFEIKEEIKKEVISDTIASTTASTTSVMVASTTPTTPAVPPVQLPFVWRDLIIKNKDTRA